MSKWYYLVKGKPQGPITENQIREMLRGQQLTLNDIIFREGDSKWRRVSEFTDLNFAQEIPKETGLENLIKLPQNTGTDKWVVLLKIQTDTEVKFIQKGSWTTEEVKNAIQRGEVSYSDHIWKPGFTKWQRIGDLDEFAFRGETQMFSTYKPKLQLSEEDIKTTKEVPEEELSDKTRMGFTLKLDRSRLQELIAKASEEVQNEKQANPARWRDPMDSSESSAHESHLQDKQNKEFLKTENNDLLKNKTTEKLEKNQKEEPQNNKLEEFINNKKDHEPRIPFAPSAGGSPNLSVQPPPTNLASHTSSYTRSDLKFDDDEENSKEPSIWFASGKRQILSQKVARKGRTKRSIRQGVWYKVFQWSQISMLMVFIGLVILTIQTLQNKKEKMKNRLKSSSVHSSSPNLFKEKKRELEQKLKETNDVKMKAIGEPKIQVNVKNNAILGTQEVGGEKSMATLNTLVQAPNEPPLQPRTAAPFVHFETKKSDGLIQQIKLISNANEGELIKVTISGETGEVLGRPSFFMTQNVIRRRGSKLELDVKNLGIPPGYYSIDAELAGVHFRRGNIFIGSKKEYIQNLARYRKSISYRQQWEKKTLVRISEQMTLLTQELFKKYEASNSLKDWQNFFSNWYQRYRQTDLEELKKISENTRQTFAFPELWLDLRSFRERLISQADLMNSNFLTSRRAASVLDKSLLQEADRLFQRAGELSGWRQKSSN